MRHAAPRRTGPPVALLVGILLSAVVVGGAAVVSGVGSAVEEPAPRYAEPEPAAAPVDPLAPRRRTPPGLGMLRDFDAARAEAWAAGDPDALAELYLPGSPAGERDVAALTAYVDRGLRVEGLRTQVLSAELRRDARRLRVVAVTDRVVGGRVTDAAGARTALPHDGVTRHLLTWRRVDGSWLLARVAPA